MPLNRSDGSAFIRLGADYTLTDSTSAQKLFNTTTAGALALSTGLYEFRSVIYVTGMSATSGNADLGLLGAGTATLAGQVAVISGRDQTTLGPTTMTGAFVYAINLLGGDVMQAATGTGMWASWSGMFTCTAAGTMIPSISLTTGGVTPAVKAGSFFLVQKLAASGINSKGAWS